MLKRILAGLALGVLVLSCTTAFSADEKCTCECQCNTNTVAVQKFPVFKRLTLGNQKDYQHYKGALKFGGFLVGGYAEELLNRVAYAQIPYALDLVVLSVSDLGFTQNTRLDAIYAKAKERGLQLCPAEVGPALRLAYPDQPYGEWLTIAMEPITDSSGDPDVFRVDRGYGDRWLYASDGGPGSVWRAGNRFVFVSPRK